PLPSRPGQPSVLLYCRTCLEVRLMSPSDAAPHYRSQGDDFEEEPDQERAAFLQRHRGHPLTVLKRKTDRFFADRPVWDPLRTDITAPRQYTLLRGSLDMTTTVALPEEPLRDTLAHSSPCSAAQLASVVKALQHAVATLPPEELIPAYCAADDPEVSFAYLAEHHLRMLAHRCSEAGLASERKRLWDFFISKQQEEELTVEMRQHCRLNFS